MFLTLQAVCSHISKVDRTDEELLLDIARGLNVYFNYTGGATCFNRSEAATGDLSDIGWEYQVGRHTSHIINVLICKFCTKFAETVLYVDVFVLIISQKLVKKTNMTIISVAQVGN